MKPNDPFRSVIKNGRFSISHEIYNGNNSVLFRLVIPNEGFVFYQRDFCTYNDNWRLENCYTEYAPLGEWIL